MSFTRQGGAVEQALVSGGLTPLAANAVMYAIANCAQPLEHRGPFSISYVPQQVRLQTPERAKYSPPDRLPFQSSEGERRAFKCPPPSYMDVWGRCKVDEEPEDPPEAECKLEDVCSRLDDIESRVSDMLDRMQGYDDLFRDLGENLLPGIRYELDALSEAIKSIRETLKNTTDCPDQ
jgi:hypothetical protein